MQIRSQDVRTVGHSVRARHHTLVASALREEETVELAVIDNCLLRRKSQATRTSGFLLRSSYD